MDLQTPVTVEVEESGVYYQVAIFPVTGTIGLNVVCTEEVMVNMNTSSSSGISLSIIILVTILLMLMLLPLLAYCYKRRCHHKGSPIAHEMDPNRSTCISAPHDKCQDKRGTSQQPLLNVSTTEYGTVTDDPQLKGHVEEEARPIGTEGGAGEVQTNGTGDDAEHGTEDAHNIARPIGTEGGAGEVQANGTGDDAEHGTEDAREIEQDNVNEKVKAIEDQDEYIIRYPSGPLLTEHHKETEGDVGEVQTHIETVPDDVPQLLPTTPSGIMNDHHVNGNGTEQIDPEPQNNALNYNDSTEAVPLEQQNFNPEDLVVQLSQDVCQKGQDSNLAIHNPDFSRAKDPPKRQLRDFSQEIDGPIQRHDIVIDMEEVVRPHSIFVEVAYCVDDVHKPKEGSAHSIETEGGASEVQTNGTGDDAGGQE